MVGAAVVGASVRGAVVVGSGNRGTVELDDVRESGACVVGSVILGVWAGGIALVVVVLVETGIKRASSGVGVGSGVGAGVVRMVVVRVGRRVAFVGAGVSIVTFVATVVPTGGKVIELLVDRVGAADALGAGAVGIDVAAKITAPGVLLRWSMTFSPCVSSSG
ncbi:hypothetical protein H310_11216 [Aphanomyces invadans]|uniref:Uncharacterized protein n=1 Tax=Aphanomyces invadans TaxID=157072 RepID=A0A024TMU4_9STRA|nr:hypothetical protein H310_11216 [Aphanomyces invadans]ETV95319.1 hypothetical protein H310_11216 [Aphanomyces invadans]|eukprot:XP_008876020.1 hypothetical protein H310_11216 [Aphanomyces invadans]